MGAAPLVAEPHFLLRRMSTSRLPLASLVMVPLPPSSRWPVGTTGSTAGFGLCVPAAAGTALPPVPPHWPRLALASALLIAPKSLAKHFWLQCVKYLAPARCAV